MICDLHLHSNFSRDSKATLEQYCRKALADKVNCICFTEHIALHPDDYGFGFYGADNFFSEFQKIKDKYGERIQLLCGIEFSEPHLYPSELLKLSEYPYDFIIGSVHWIGNALLWEKTVQTISAEKIYEMYWSEVLKAVEFGHFDCLGHIDYPKRYYGKVLYDNAIINEIYKAMHRNNIVLEINTSSLRKGLSSSMPDQELLAIYKNSGGQYVTVGSDAHSAEDLCADNHYARKLIDMVSLTEVLFLKHRPHAVKD